MATQHLFHLTVLYVLAMVGLSSGGPVTMTDAKILSFLKQYGYLESTSHTMDEEAVTEALRTLQHNYGAETPSGLMDESTQKMMEMPRCGLADFQAGTSKWPKRELTYRINSYTVRPIARGDVDKTIAQAFNYWSGSTNLIFTPKPTGRVDIDIDFAKQDHDDGNTFDGTGGTLAHAFYPRRGDAHFDDEEKWTLSGNAGTNLLQVATHEFGHSLGLGHSDVRAAIMAPYYEGYVPNFKLHTDDIAGIQFLYGPKSSQEPAAPPDKFSLCSDPSIDAALSTPDRKTYFFKGMKFWEIQSSVGLADGYPKNINTRWPELPHTLDAAFYSSKNRKTYFFKGMMVWRYKDLTLDQGYPKKISAEFPGIFANNLNAAFEWSGDGNVHFFRDGKHWCFDGRRVCAGYPRQMSEWGLPNKVDAALRYDYSGYRMYFFNGRQYYRFDDKTMKVKPETLFSTANNWLHCPAS